jgi:hypothetical protein
MPHSRDASRPRPRSPSAKEREEYDLLILLEALESLVEEMDELRISSRAEAMARIGELHARLEQEA